MPLSPRTRTCGARRGDERDLLAELPRRRGSRRRCRPRPPRRRGAPGASPGTRASATDGARRRRRSAPGCRPPRRAARRRRRSSRRRGRSRACRRSRRARRRARSAELELGARDEGVAEGARLLARAGAFADERDARPGSSLASGASRPKTTSAPCGRKRTSPTRSGSSRHHATISAVASSSFSPAREGSPSSPRVRLVRRSGTRGRY